MHAELGRTPRVSIAGDTSSRSLHSGRDDNSRRRDQLDEFGRLGMFSLEYLNETKIRLEVVRADLNEELTTALQDVEQNDAGRFSRMQRSLENQLKDPADAFLQAQHREREIKEQIEELQHSLEFRKPKVRKRAGR